MSNAAVLAQCIPTEIGLIIFSKIVSFLRLLYLSFIFFIVAYVFFHWVLQAEWIVRPDPLTFFFPLQRNYSFLLPFVGQRGPLVVLIKC